MHLFSADEILSQVALLDFASHDVRADLLDDASCGPALRAYLALTDGRLGGGLTPEDRFYNRYFWFLRFAHAHRAKFGEDVGIEQQAFQILEYPDCNVDWHQIQQLEELARLSY